jgi:hypothetical protein
MILNYCRGFRRSLWITLYSLVRISTCAHSMSPFWAMNLILHDKASEPTHKPPCHPTHSNKPQNLCESPSKWRQFGYEPASTFTRPARTLLIISAETKRDRMHLIVTSSCRRSTTHNKTSRQRGREREREWWLRTSTYATTKTCGLYLTSCHQTNNTGRSKSRAHHTKSH